ncbi:MAG: multiprotein-bridging factor 1 family protein [Haloferacaceae archaeon]
MAKYSTGGSRAGDEGDSCELCGRETGNLRKANVAGANLLVCESCAPHGARETSRETSGDDERSRKKRTAQKAAKMYDAGRGDSSHWEKEGTDYEKDRLPYLVSNYGDRVETARQEAGLTVADLAAELDVDEDDVLAVEQGRATQANVGGSVVRALEERLDVRLVEE